MAYKDSGLHAERRSKYRLDDEVMAFNRIIGQGYPVIVFDLETTGLSRNMDRILSFSAIKAELRNHVLTETGRMNVFINPGFPIPFKITQINHISDDTVRDCGTEDDVLPQIRDFIGEALLCGYNSRSFDIPFLNQAYLRVFGTSLSCLRDIDVMQMAKDVCAFRKYKLEDVAGQLGMSAGLTFHNSMDDVIATFRLLKHFLSMYAAEDSQEDQKMDVHVVGVKEQCLSHIVHRLYINTMPPTETWYDFYKGEWVSNVKGLDMERMRADVLRAHRVEDEKGLAALYRQGRAGTGAGL